MWKPPIPVDEHDRLADLRRLDTLLTAPEEPLDTVTRELARIFDVPGAFISFIDEDTQYYKSQVGLPPPFSDTRTEPRDVSLCSYVVGTNDRLIVEDLSADERFRDNPAVRQFGARFYAGAPLRGDGGHAVGSLCIVDMRPRKITPREQEMLTLLADGVMARVRLQSASRQLLHRTLEIERDLRQATAVQRFLLPEPRIDAAGWRVEHVYRPVEHLGGDFVDVQRRPDGGLAVLIADVSGHGTSAALTAAMTKTAFLRAIAQPLASGGADGGVSPAAVLRDMNRELSPLSPPGQFVTAQVVALAPSSGRATIASAGHPYPLALRGGAASMVELDNGPPLLVHERAEYGDHAMDNVADGDALLLYTDGAVEAMNEQRRQLGVDGLCRQVGAAASDGELSLAKLLSRVIAYAQGRLADDVALLTIRRSAAAG
jgi:serine phosphatase RsbU (regulator of sigma subunit)